jgi:predicted CopG family antitoxin
MRTTLTVDDDVAAMLERLRKTREQSFKDLVNEALRRGLKQMDAQSKRREPFHTQSVDNGRCRIGSIDNVAEALAIAEDESFG